MIFRPRYYDQNPTDNLQLCTENCVNHRSRLLFINDYVPGCTFLCGQEHNQHLVNEDQITALTQCNFPYRIKDDSKLTVGCQPISSRV